MTVTYNSVYQSNPIKLNPNDFYVNVNKREDHDDIRYCPSNGHSSQRECSRQLHIFPNRETVTRLDFDKFYFYEDLYMAEPARVATVRENFRKKGFCRLDFGTQVVWVNREEAERFFSHPLSEPDVQFIQTVLCSAKTNRYNVDPEVKKKADLAVILADKSNDTIASKMNSNLLSKYKPMLFATKKSTKDFDTFAANLRSMLSYKNEV